jgi:hypothetical protein
MSKTEQTSVGKSFFKTNGEDVSVWHVLRACAEFKADFDVKMPSVLLDKKIPKGIAMSDTVASLYVDIMDAQADGVLSEFLLELAEFVDEGVEPDFVDEPRPAKSSADAAQQETV